MPMRPWSRLAKYLRGRAQYCLCGRGFDNETVIVFVACEVLKLRFKVLPGLAKCQYNCLPEGVRVCIWFTVKLCSYICMPVRFEVPEG